MPRAVWHVAQSQPAMTVVPTFTSFTPFTWFVLSAPGDA
jgi:hypothetical protein